MIRTEPKFIYKSVRQDFISFIVLFIFLWLTVLPCWEKVELYPNFLALIYFHWLLYRPDLITLPPLMGVSLIRDGLLASWLGLSLLHFLSLYFIVYILRQFFVYRSFFGVFLGALGFVGIDSFLSWVFLSYQIGSWISYYPFGKGALLTICFYPFVTLISAYTQKRYLTLL